MASSNISCVPTFDTADDPSSLAVKWGRWKRAFKLYLVARGETAEAKKEHYVCIVLVCICARHFGDFQTRELTMICSSCP